ncbi:MAG: flavodoxin family protein [Clostridia bacterium]|nr:flavodoxin family protein [Clostridia bacterium]
MRKILVVKGSPRKLSFSGALADKAVKGIKDAGGTVEEIVLENYNIKPCRACNGCEKSESICTVKDDMAFLYNKITEADGFILASPVYWFNMTAQMKTFIDRWYALFMKDENFLKDKTAGIIMTYADDDAFSSGAVNALRSFQDIFNYCQGHIIDIVHTCEENLKEKKHSIFEKSYELGQMLAKDHI